MDSISKEEVHNWKLSSGIWARLSLTGPLDRQAYATLVEYVKLIGTDLDPSPPKDVKLTRQG